MLVRVIAATGLCGRDVGWGCDRLIAAAGLWGRNVVWGATDGLLLLDYAVGMLVGGATDPTKCQRKTSCIYYRQDRSRSAHSLGVTLYFLPVLTA